jgi:hypothetical protein
MKRNDLHMTWSVTEKLLIHYYIIIVLFLNVVIGVFSAVYIGCPDERYPN